LAPVAYPFPIAAPIAFAAAGSVCLNM
jgi:hypothetical protein